MTADLAHRARQLHRLTRTLAADLDDADEATAANDADQAARHLDQLALLLEASNIVVSRRGPRSTALLEHPPDNS